MKVDLLDPHLEVPDFTLFSQSAFLSWNLRSCLIEADGVVDVSIRMVGLMLRLLRFLRFDR